MKKISTILSLSLLIAACGGNSSTETATNSDTTAAANTAVVTDSIYKDSTAKDTVAAAGATEIQKRSTPPPAPKPPAKPAADNLAAGSVKGGELLKANDCLTCHRVDVKLVGPAYKDVAAKYKPTAENIDMLVNKVINGGAGNWGQIPMSPHPNLSKSDAKEMVKYILAVK